MKKALGIILILIVSGETSFLAVQLIFGWKNASSAGFLILATIVVSVMISENIKSHGSEGYVIYFPILLFGAFFFMLIYSLNNNPVLSKEQIIAAHRYFPQTNDAASDLCSLKRTCEIYVAKRADCATAGNIEKCVEIKMKNRDFSNCTTSGGIYGLSEKTTPKTIQCIVNSGLIDAAL